MNQTEPTQETMQRIRANLSRKRRNGSSTGTPFFGRPFESQKGESIRTANAPIADFPTTDISTLRKEVEGALAGHRMVGQANPRPPGIHNRAIQFAKRAMLRLLTFYTRPLQHFQGSTIRALQGTTETLKIHDDELQELKRAVMRQSAVLEEVRRQSWTTVKMVQAANDKGAAAQARLAGEVERLEGELRAQAGSNERLTQGVGSLRQNFAALAESVDERYSNVLGRVEAHETRLDELPPHIQRIGPMAEEVNRIQAELQRRLEDAETRARLHQRDLRRYLNEARAGNADRPAAVKEPAVPAMFASGATEEGSFDYFRFEELFRGDEVLIAERQKNYLEYFRGRNNVVDLGCGRGEFLELLRENGIRSKGVELGSDQYLLCRDKGLDVVQQDLFKFLENVEDGSLGGIFSAQVIEHLTASDQLRLVRLAYQKTAPGSPVIFETINAQSVFAIMRNFFLDPTHVRPVHPETLKIAMESADFRDVELKFSSLYTEQQIPPLELPGDGMHLAEFNKAMKALNDLVYGYLDYAAIGWH